MAENLDNTLQIFSINQSNGYLTERSAETLSVTGLARAQLDPRSFYGNSGSPNQIKEYRFNSSNGTLAFQRNLRQGAYNPGSCSESELTWRNLGQDPGREVDNYPALREKFVKGVNWLRDESGRVGAEQLELGRLFYERIAGQLPPSRGPVPALSHSGLDQIAQRLLAPNPNDRYPGLESLRWDLEEERWNAPDFLAASGLPRKVPAAPALIGRRSQLDWLLELPPGISYLLGPAGMGKTRLLREAARHALGAGWRVWSAECLQRSQLSVQPFQDLAAELARHPEVWRTVERHLGEWLPAVLRLFPVLRPLSVAAPEESGQRDFLTERNRGASLALLRAMGPAVFVVDDLHWADGDVLDCLSKLAWPVLGGARMAVPGEARMLPLRPLNGEQIGALARSMCGPVECLELSAWSQGHPLLAAALLRNLCDSGALEASREGWLRSQRAPAWGALSPNLEEILRLRCLTLTESAQRVLRQAALLGRRFAVRLLEEPDAGLREGEQGGLLYRVETGIWDFTHDLIWQELSRASSPSEKIDFHRRVVECLLLEADPPPGLMAEHLWESNQLELCLPWTRRAAREFQADGQLEAAAHFWERAAHLRPQEFEAWFEWGCVLRYLGRCGAARAPLDRALQLSQTALQRASCRAQLGENDWRDGDLSAAAEHFRRGLAELDIHVPQGRRMWAAILRELMIPFPTGPRQLNENQRLAARMLDQLGYTLAYSGGLAMAWANLRGLRLTANYTGVERGVLMASHAVLVVHLAALIPRARRFATEALRLVAHDRYHLAPTRARYGSVMLFTGELESGEAYTRQAYEALQRSGDRFDLRMSRYNLAYQLYWLGRLEESGQLAEEGWQDARGAGDWLLAAYFARMVALQGRVPEDFYRHFADAQTHPVVEALRQEVLGLLALIRGRPEAAAEHLLDATTRCRRLGFMLDATWQSGWLAAAYRTQAELAPLARRQELYRKGLAEARRACKHGKSGYPTYLPQALREAAWCSLGMGGNGDEFAESLEWARRLKMAHEERVTLAEMARAGISGGLSCADSFWQFQAPAQGALRLASRFDESVEQVRRILGRRTNSEVLVQAEEAAEKLLGATACRVIPGGPALERAVVEQTPTRSEVHASLLIPLGGSLTLACYQHNQPDRFGEEEIYLGTFLGAVVGAALENAEMLEERSGLFEAVPVGVASLDAGGVVLRANPSLKEMLGEGVEGRRLEDFEYRGPGADGSMYLSAGGQLIWADRRVAALGPERSVVSLSDVSWRRLRQVAAFQEQERRLMGIEVHDVSQPLIGLCYELSARGQSECAEVARKLLSELRGLMFDLRTPHLDDFDLAQSLRDLMHEVCSLCALQCETEITPEVAEVEGLPALFAYRIAVEGMSNVRRHSGAERVLLRLRRVGSHLQGSLCDDGRGRVDSSSQRGFGLAGIAERAQLLGGWARLRRLAAGGSVLHFRLPLEVS